MEEEYSAFDKIQYFPAVSQQNAYVCWAARTFYGGDREETSYFLCSLHNANTLKENQHCGHTWSDLTSTGPELDNKIWVQTMEKPEERGGRHYEYSWRFSWRARTSRKLHGKLTLWSYVGKIYRTFNFSEAMVIIDNAESVWCVELSERVLTKHSLGSRVSFNILIIWTAIAKYNDNNQVFCESTKTKSKLKVETFCQCNAILKYCPRQQET